MAVTDDMIDHRVGVIVIAWPIAFFIYGPVYSKKINVVM